jgi:hypothetical protein
MNERPQPHISAALLCERILTEKDGVQTLVRIVDTLTGRYSATEVPPGSKARVKFQVWLVVTLKSGEAKGKYTLRVRMNDPSGKQVELSEEMPIVLDGGEHGVNVNILLDLTVTDGLFWVDVMVDDRVLTRVPLKVRLEPHDQARPENSIPSQAR